MSLADDEKDLAVVTSRLGAALSDARGKLRAQDALRLAGFERRTNLRALVVARAMRDLGWDRGRYRFDGRIEYAFARGTSLDREVVLDVDRVDDHLVVRRREP